MREASDHSASLVISVILRRGGDSSWTISVKEVGTVWAKIKRRVTQTPAST